MFSFSIGIEKPTCQREWTESERDYYLHLVDAAIERGCHARPRCPRTLVPVLLTFDADIDETLNVFADIVKTVKR